MLSETKRRPVARAQRVVRSLYSAGQQNTTIFLAADLDFLRENGPRIRSQKG